MLVAVSVHTRLTWSAMASACASIVVAFRAGMAGMAGHTIGGAKTWETTLHHPRLDTKARGHRGPISVLSSFDIAGGQTDACGKGCRWRRGGAVVEVVLGRANRRGCDGLIDDPGRF
ncbi:hypothetical protein F5X68DRAFT_40708 [Plectosphaerella plurivora]|uniref:Uncharacterized protein n=1 Tax=Plectosphaerella plurivora TaxID=936078 RepID=A0A9P8V5B4_9PEZI|nr:hypothetical protein F5X68DRAFT_40708 [Plectosphaerella plurivora]